MKNSGVDGGNESADDLNEIIVGGGGGMRGGRQNLQQTILPIKKEDSTETMALLGRRRAK